VAVLFDAAAAVFLLARSVVAGSLADVARLVGSGGVFAVAAGGGGLDLSGPL
jgi:hypothetical protein